MNVLYVCREHPEKLPPIVSFVIASKDLGHNVDVISFFSGSDIFNLGILSPTQSLLKYCQFLKSIENKYDLIVFGSLDSTFYFYPYIIQSKKPKILHLHELYDKFYFHTKWLKFISDKFFEIVTSNHMRASYLFGMNITNKLPKFLDNIPYHINVDDYYQTPHEFNVDCEYIIYQGHILPDRRLDLIEKLIYDETDYNLVVVGKNHTNYVFSNQTIIFDWTPPPNYLYITANAKAGILKYDHTSLNNLFCAPNKLYEYLLFNLPLLANDNPTLESFISYNNVGVTYSENEESIKYALRSLSKNYNHYKDNALKLDFKIYYLERLSSIYRCLENVL